MGMTVRQMTKYLSEYPDDAGIGIHKKQILKVESDESWIECYRRATESLVEWERTEEQEAKVS